ncbi:MAG: hypothetical protein ABIO71_00110, partial [Caldimonas sp.]
SRRSATKLAALEIRPRWLAQLLALVGVLLGVAGLLAWRRYDPDFDDGFELTLFLLTLLWLAAVIAGGLVRQLLAGYALRLDALGLHLPGLPVIPWPSVHTVSLRKSNQGLGKHSHQLVVKTEIERTGPSLRHYERFVFGPFAGLLKRNGEIAIALAPMRVEPEQLLLDVRAFKRRLVKS